MPAAEADLPSMLADFGEVFTHGAVQFKALLDQPDELVSLPGTQMVSRQFEITYLTSAVVLARDVVISHANGTNYRVREVPQLVGDGAFTRATLSRAVP